MGSEATQVSDGAISRGNSAAQFQTLQRKELSHLQRLLEAVGALQAAGVVSCSSFGRLGFGVATDHGRDKDEMHKKETCWPVTGA